MRYSFSEFVKNCYSLFLTKLFFPSARLVRRPIYIRGKGMVFGKGFTTGYRCRIELLGSNGEDTLLIGNQCKLGDSVHITASKRVVIGDDCLFASNIYVSDTNHGDNSSDPTIPPDKRPLSSSPVTIGNCVWLGEGVSVLPGSKIGDGCVIGAHSVVKGVIPEFSIAVGAPARVVKRYNFDTKCWERV